jgi:hypothetical protein
MQDLIVSQLQEDEGETFLGFNSILGDSDTMIKIADRGIAGKGNRLVVRSFYDDFAGEMLQDITDDHIHRIYVTGTPGTGKSSFRNYLVWKILQQFKAENKSVRIALHKGGINYFHLLCLEVDHTYRVEKWTVGQFVDHNRLLPSFKLGANFFALSDVSEGNNNYCHVFAGGSFIFSSPNPDTWMQGGKDNCLFYFMPLWEEEELCRFDTPERKFKKRYEKYGGVVRLVWGQDKIFPNYQARLFRKDIEFSKLHAQVESTSWESVPHRVIYLMVNKLEGKYQWCDEPSLIFPTRYIARLLAEAYVKAILESTKSQFGLVHATVDGLLFEAVVLDLIGKHRGACEFKIIRLTEGKRFHLFDRNSLVIPNEMKSIGFDTPLFESTISEEGCVLALPDSNYFPGFDAAISFEYSKTEEGQVIEKRGLVLIQVTMAQTHPLSHEGLLILESVHNLQKKNENVATTKRRKAEVPSCLFDDIIIMYVVPSSSFNESFGLQELTNPQRASERQKELFRNTAQVLMCIDVVTRNGPHIQKKHGNAAAEED